MPPKPWFAITCSTVCWYVQAAGRFYVDTLALTDLPASYGSEREHGEGYG